jgi:hypothetical protein
MRLRYTCGRVETRAPRVNTVIQGNTFRDIIRDFLRAAGYDAETEVLIAGKKVDVLAQRRAFGGTDRIAIEAKDFTGNLPVADVQEFTHAYSGIVRSGHADRGLLVTRGDVTPQGRDAIEAARGDRLKHLTWQGFQRAVFGPDDYLNALINEHKRAGIDNFYISPRTEAGDDLMTLVDDWMAEPAPPPLVILGDYGSGKSTFAQTLARLLAEQSVADPLARIPVLVRLGDLAEETRLDGLFGTLLASRYHVDTWHYDLFRELNRFGRLIIIFDALDEMKHGMTFVTFKREVARLFELHEGQSRIILLGRPNAFPDDQAFRAVIKGRITDAAGEEYALPNRPECRDVKLVPWTDDEAARFVKEYTHYHGHERGLDDATIQRKLNELTRSRFEQLIRRPVHAQMLCQLAVAAAQRPLDDIDEFQLYDRFVTLLLDREASKPGRYPAFGVEIRRKFNASVAWWLLTNAGAISTSLDGIPIQLCEATVSDVEHEFDADGLRQELVAGCLVEKGSGRVYYGHRSIQEFLAAEHLFVTSFGLRIGEAGSGLQNACAYASPEVAEFLSHFFRRHVDGREHSIEVREFLARFTGDLPQSIAPLSEALRAVGSTRQESQPWLFYVEVRGSDKDWTPTAVDRLIETLSNPNTSREQWLMAAQAIAIGPFNRVSIQHATAAALVKASNIRTYVAQVKGGEDFLIDASEDYRTTCLVSAVSTNQNTAGTGRVVFDWTRLYETARTLLGYGPFVAELNTSESYLNPQQIYSALNWRDHELDRIRPFFNDPEILRTLRASRIVVETVNRRRVSPAKTSRHLKPILTIPRRPPTSR